MHRQGGNQSIGRERVKTELPGCKIASSEHELHPSPEDNPKHCLFIQKKKRNSDIMHKHHHITNLT